MMQSDNAKMLDAESRTPAGRARAWLDAVPRGVWVAVPFAILLLFAVVVGLRGLDFPYHPDERINLNTVRTAYETKDFVPQVYFYPSLFHWIEVWTALPDVAATVHTHQGDGPLLDVIANTIYGDYDATLLPRLEEHAFELRVRGAFLLVSLLGLVWVYAAVLVWRESWGEALLAAALIALSWEISTHARWIAPDVVMMQFGALTLLCAFLAVKRAGSRWWLAAAAVAAGLATGTKYPGGMLFLLVLIAASPAQAAGDSWARRLGRFAAQSVPLAALFALTYLITTPGTVLIPAIFLQELTDIVSHYGEGHYGYTVEPGLSHAGHNLEWLVLVLWSRAALIGVAVTALIVVGAGVVLREWNRYTALLMVVPPLYFVYMSGQRAFYVRNLFVIAPFLALMAAAGAGWLWARLRIVPLRAALAGGLAVMLAFNAVDMVRSANSVARSAEDESYALAELVDYLDDHADTQILASQRVIDDLLAYEGQPRDNVRAFGHWDEFDLVLWDRRADRLHTPVGWPMPRRGLFTRIFGPDYFNVDYYPSRRGYPYLLVEPGVFLDMGYQNGLFERIADDAVEGTSRDEIHYSREGPRWTPDIVLTMPAGATVSWAPTFYTADKITLQSAVAIKRNDGDPVEPGEVCARIVVQEGDVFTTEWEGAVVADYTPVEVDLTPYGGIPIRVFFEVEEPEDTAAENLRVRWLAPDVRYD